MGNVIIENPSLRQKFQLAHKATGTMPNLFGMKIAESVYTNGHTWLHDLLIYLKQNIALFDEGICQISGLKSMKLSATYLAWVDFSNTGMSEAEIIQKIQKIARIAPSIGSTFGTGGEKFMRFNLACPKAKVNEAVQRLGYAFG